MSIFRRLKSGTEVCAKALYYSTWEAVADPAAAREFRKAASIAMVDFVNVIADFRPTPKPLLPELDLHTLCAGAEEFPAIDLLPHDEWELPPDECACLARLVRYLQPRTVFEFGTFRGRTTRLIAANAPAGAEVYTIDLPPKRFRHFSGASEELLGEEFSGHHVVAKIRQLYGDTRTFDFHPFYESMDLIFIDGDHRYEGVRSDTQQALRMIKPGGVIIWDDYQALHPGVMHCLNELGKERALFRIKSTRFAYHRAMIVGSGQLNSSSRACAGNQSVQGSVR